nr:MAG TPA: hypothetical protein [Caudoviricetes sp.]
MDADDRTEVTEFWEQVRWYLPPYLRDKRVLLTEARSPDGLEFCPGGRPTGLSSESEDAIKALLNRVRESLEANNRIEK